MKKIISIILTLVILLAFGICALGSGSDEDETSTPKSSVSAEKSTAKNTVSKEKATAKKENKNALGKYEVEIKSCRLEKDYEGKDVAIVKYKFTNNNSKPASFALTIDDAAFQNDIGLNEAFILPDSAEYDVSTASKEIKKGASLDVEVAYELDNTKDDVVVEVKQLISLDDTTITKTFKLK